MSETSSQPRGGESANEPWTHWAAWSLLPARKRADLAVLFAFNAAVRAVADHPSASIERKETALAELASPFSQTATSETPAAIAQALAELLNERGISAMPAWQVLQAAGQDLRKTRYRDWSELLTYCNFAAAPLGTLAEHLTGEPNVRGATPLSLAVQLLDIVERAPTHYRWLGRVYLPERWFTEAGAEMSDLEFARISPPLAKVRARALDQAAALMDEAVATGHGFDWRGRAALAALVRELNRRISDARKAREHTAPAPGLASGARRMIVLRAAVWATFWR